MLVFKLISTALAFLWSAQAVSCLYIRSSPPATCTNPVVRKEWRALSTDEKAEWIRAIKCMAQQPHDPALTPSVDPSISLIPPVNATSSFYDDITYLHMDLNTRIHWTGYFLPWHRWYIQVLENSMKSKCGFTGVSPYWNWTIDAPDFYESSWWKDSDPVSGLGGWGDPNNDYAVPDGGFSDFSISYPVPHTIRRNFTLYPFNISLSIFTNPLLQANESILPSAVEAVLNASAGDFRSFQVPLEAPEGPHGGPHALTSGDLGGRCPTAAANCTPGFTWSPNDPLFFLHHAMVDKIWYDWQSRDPENVFSFFGGSVQHIENLTSYTQYPSGGPPYLGLESKMPADGLFPEAEIGDVMNTTGGYLCYVYE